MTKYRIALLNRDTLESSTHTIESRDGLSVAEVLTELFHSLDTSNFLIQTISEKTQFDTVAFIAMFCVLSEPVHDELMCGMIEAC